MCDNLRSHIATMIRNKIAEFGWETLDHPPYSPDIAPPGYYVFRSMQKSIANIQFRNVEYVRKWLDNSIAERNEDFFKHGIDILPERWAKVIASNCILQQLCVIKTFPMRKNIRNHMHTRNKKHCSHSELVPCSFLACEESQMIFMDW